MTEPLPRDTVRLTAEAAGMPAGSQGVLLGWYAREEREALVNFWDGGPLRVPASLVEPADEDVRR